MRKILCILGLFFLSAVACRAQNGNAVVLGGAGAPTGNCAFMMFWVNSTTADFYDCQAGSWVKIGPPAGGIGPCITTALSLQYNNGGAFGCVAQFTYSGSTLTGTSGTLDLTAMTLVKQRVSAGLTTSVNGDLGQNSSDGRWHIWKGSDDFLIAMTNVGVSGQVPISNADGTATFADPIVSGPDAVSSAPTRNPVQVGCVFQTAPATLTNNQVGEVQCDTSQRLLVDVAVAPTTTVTGTVTTTPPANASTNVVQWASSNLGAMANYGSSPGAVLVPGMNAFVTNTVPVTGTFFQSTQPMSCATAATCPVNASQVGGPWTQNLTQVAGSTLGAITTYGTSPGAVNVPSVNAFITNTPAVTLTSTTITGTVGVTQSTSPWADNITQFGGVNLSTGTGTSGTGIPRVTVANDSNILATQSGTWNIGAVTGNVTVVQPTGTNLHAVLDTTSTTTVTQATGANLHVTCDSGCTSAGITAPGTSPANPSYGISSLPTFASAGAGASPTTSELIAGQFSAPDTPLFIGQSLPFQMDKFGNLKVSIAATPLPSLPTVTTPVVVGVLTDRSGTVTTGGTSQVLAPANPGRRYLTIENPTTASEALYVNFTSAASTSVAGSISLAPGGSLTMSAATYVSQEVITVTAATATHAFTAKEQ